MAFEEDAAQQIAQPAVKIVAVMGLGATSWTLQDISYVVSIVAGILGILYSLHLLTEWWWKKLWRRKFTDWGWYVPSPTTRKKNG